MSISQSETPVNQPEKKHSEKSNRSKESIMFLQSILICLLLAIAVLTLWTICTALGYLIQSDDLSLWYRFIRSSAVATAIIVAGIFYLRRIYRTGFKS